VGIWSQALDLIVQTGKGRDVAGIAAFDHLEKEGSSFVLEDNVDWEKEGKGELKPLYEDGKFLRKISLSEIRKKVERAAQCG